MFHHFCWKLPIQGQIFRVLEVDRGVPVGTAKFDLNRCNESPLRGEKPDFWPVSKNNTGSLPLRGNPAGNKLFLSYIFFLEEIGAALATLAIPWLRPWNEL